MHFYIPVNQLYIVCLQKSHQANTNVVVHGDTSRQQEFPIGLMEAAHEVARTHEAALQFEQQTRIHGIKQESAPVGAIPTDVTAVMTANAEERNLLINTDVRSISWYIFLGYLSGFEFQIVWFLCFSREQRRRNLPRRERIQEW